MNVEHTGDEPLRLMLQRTFDADDPVPSEVTLAARSAIAWRDMDAKIAELLYDSAEQSLETAGVRSIDGPQMLSFGSGDVSVELQITRGDDGLRIVGQISPAAVEGVDIFHRGGTTIVSPNATGSFSAGPVLPGPLSVRVRLPGDGAVQTVWITT
jgi:hypothetical protein